MPCPLAHRKRPSIRFAWPPATPQRPTARGDGGVAGSIRIFATELVSLQRRPGEAISEAEIALSYGVSRTPVREAILKLSDEGLLEIYPQSGIFVSRIPVAALPEAIIIRKALEETTARLGRRARHLEPDPRRCIRSWSASARPAPPEISETFHQADEAFHATSRRCRGLSRNLEV